MISSRVRVIEVAAAQELDAKMQRVVTFTHGDSGVCNVIASQTLHFVDYGVVGP
jgi:hypothetical protein